MVAEERRDHDGDDPAEEERDADDGEEGGAELARHALGEGDGDEARAGDEGACEHGFCRLGKGVAGGVKAGLAALELDAHHLDGDDGVVDEQSEGDDECTEGDLVQVDAEGVHADECACEDERDAARDNEPGAQSEREEADGENDDDGDGQRLDKVVDGVLYDGGLVRYLVQLHAEREVLSELCGEFLEVLAEREDVAAVLHGDGDADGGCAVIQHFRVGGVNRAT